MRAVVPTQKQRINSWFLLLLALPIGLLHPAWAEAGSLVEFSLQWPSWEELFRVLTLQDYNTRVVVIGATFLGIAAGLIGTFLLLRKRALLSDTISHATLPGIALAFILFTYLLGEGKNLLGLIAGASVFSILATGSVIFVQRHSRLKEDAALGIVLSVYFGLGIALLGLATRMETGNAAGLTSFIYGKTASMLFFDAVLIGISALVAAGFCILFFKEFTLLCFDQNYASTQGWPVLRLDMVMMSVVVIVTVVGLQAVGLILVVALLIIPPVAARFWTHHLRTMLLLSALFGGLSGLFGSAISALMANLPAGAVIVLTASLIFLISLTFGTARGLMRHMLEQHWLRRKIARENLLRSLYEALEEKACAERNGMAAVETTFHFGSGDLLTRRSWTVRELRRTLSSLRALGFVSAQDDGSYTLTDRGLSEALKVVRKHRLWEAYLISHADIAPGQVDWGADEIEHVLDPQMIGELEKKLPELGGVSVPSSPHKIKRVEGTP